MRYILNVCIFVVEVTLLNEPVVFGDNVTLICSCDKYVEKGHAWTKGNDFKQLTLGGSSNDTGKYKPLLSKNSDRYLYGLKITNFSIEDLDNYNCQFGFEKTSYKLSLDKRFACKSTNLIIMLCQFLIQFTLNNVK